MAVTLDAEIGEASEIERRDALPLNVVVRLAEPFDLTDVSRFDEYPGERINDIIERRMLVAEVDGSIEGYASWQGGRAQGRNFITNLAGR